MPANSMGDPAGGAVARERAIESRISHPSLEFTLSAFPITMGMSRLPAARAEAVFMPIHDWSHVDAGIFHAFHHDWITDISPR